MNTCIQTRTIHAKHASVMTSNLERELFAFELAGKETEPSSFPVHRRLNFIRNFPKRLN